MVGSTSEVLPLAKRSRRRFTLDFKRNIVRESLQPNVSSAAVAMSHGINPNQLKRWAREFRSLHDQSSTSDPKAVLLPVQIQHGTQLNWQSKSFERSHEQDTVGSIEIQINDARIVILGRVDVGTLSTVLATLRS